MKDYEASEIITGILASFPQDEDKFLYSQKRINDFFESNKQKYEILRGLRQDDVMTSFYTLDISGGIEAYKNSFHHRLVSQFLRLQFEKDIKNKFDQQELLEMKKVSDDFRKNLGLEKLFVEQ